MSTPNGAPKPRRLGQCTADSKVKDKYFLKIYLGKDSRGKRLYHAETFYGKRKEAEQRLREIHNRHLAGEALKPSNDTLSLFIEEWIASKSLSVAEGSIETYKQIIRNYITPHLGNLVLTRITAADIEKTYTSLQTARLGHSTISYVHVVLTMVFKLAVIRNRIVRSPMLGVSVPKDWQINEDPEPVKAMTSEQVAQFLSAAEGSRFEVYFVLAFQSGFRPGELLALKWADLDPANASIRIERAIRWRKTGDWYTKPPKTKLSRRTIPISSQIVDLLAAHRRGQLQQRMKVGRFWNENDFIFCNEVGEPFTQMMIYYEFKQVLKLAKLPHWFSPYTSRHTVATLLINSGENVKAVSQRLGHATPVTTIEKYAHVMPGAQQELSRKIEEILQAGRASK